MLCAAGTIRQWSGLLCFGLFLDSSVDPNMKYVAIFNVSQVSIGLERHLVRSRKVL